MSAEPLPPVGPRAQACAEWAAELAMQHGERGRRALYHGLLQGLSLGLALSYIDRDWGQAAADELASYMQPAAPTDDGALSCASAQKIAIFAQAQKIIDTTSGRPRDRD